MRTCVLFDLDDTLYPEADFVRSGFQAVAARVSEQWGLPVERARLALERALDQHGRGRTIDHALTELGLPVNPELVAGLVRVYREHVPTLSLHPDAARALERLTARSIPMGLVTDGDPTVQRRKVDALGLNSVFKSLVYTWGRGPEFQKPHPSGFLEALQRLGVAPGDAVYIGDNPTKDFQGARHVGLLTVRVRRGAHRDLEAAQGCEPDAEIASLDSLESAAGL